MLSKSMEVCAFFDVDETIWNEKSVITFYQFYLDITKGDKADFFWEQFNKNVKNTISAGISREELNAWFYLEHFSGVSVSHLREIAEQWSIKKFNQPSFWQDKVIERIEYHKNKGHAIVLVSGSFREVLAPLAKRLGVTDILCSPLEEKDGCYTGNMLGSPMIGYGKANAVSDYLREHHIDPVHCYGYGDDTTDIPFIGTVGNSYIVINNNHDELSVLAEIMGYQTLNV
ncbi:HAD family hydrolase [Methylobacter tundripaludum]|nr:HAD-IB family hydrolase [Methylobacter tundripaludum]